MKKLLISLILMLSLSSCKEWHKSCECVGLGIELCEQVCEGIQPISVQGLDIKIGLIEHVSGWILFEASATKDGERIDGAAGVGQFYEEVNMMPSAGPISQREQKFKVYDFGNLLSTSPDYPISINDKIKSIWGDYNGE